MLMHGTQINALQQWKYWHWSASNAALVIFDCRSYWPKLQSFLFHFHIFLHTLLHLEHLEPIKVRLDGISGVTLKQTEKLLKNVPVHEVWVKRDRTGRWEVGYLLKVPKKIWPTAPPYSGRRSSRSAAFLRSTLWWRPEHIPVKSGHTSVLVYK